MWFYLNHAHSTTGEIMNKVNVKIKIPTDKMNNNLSKYTISKYSGYSIIEMKQSITTKVMMRPWLTISIII